ncbi:pyridoxal phosphate homeostasis protein-like isoform X2 [Varroa destructor]|uniref:Pyridoxal phosphate homeostasis protein n=1 Tax=Varroa destructor TaxID=109461 RepID=A0A7M7JXE7_VARDE|nr:pyridoxal phosphate homeostasis protein-like isoform X2 [Varroa destructor]
MENHIATNFRLVSERVANAARLQPQTVRLVAVSKTKSKEDVIAAYAAGARHFGENYIQELVSKAEDPSIKENCPELKWHFIGRLQSNKVKQLAKVPGLWAVETVATPKVADSLNSSWESAQRGEPHKLNVMVQVNTSGEEQKGGVEMSEVVDLARHIREKCPRLSLLGLMTIGFADVQPGTENPDFAALAKCRNMVAEALGIEHEVLELSMVFSIDIVRLIVPKLVEDGKKGPFDLECSYRCGEGDDNLVVKWFFNNDTTPFYQWIASYGEPVITGPYESKFSFEEDQHADTCNNKVSYKLALTDPEVAMSGLYRCEVQTFDSQDSAEANMVVFSPPRNFTLVIDEPSAGVLQVE